MDKRDWYIIGGGAALTAIVGVATYEIERRRKMSGTVYPNPGMASGYPYFPSSPWSQSAGPVASFPGMQPPIVSPPPVATAPPAAPTNVRVVGVTPTAVTVSWTPVPGYSRYQVIHPAYQTQPEQIVADVQANMAAINGLAPNSPYSVWVVAVGPTGVQGPRSPLAQGSTLAAGTVPVSSSPPAAAASASPTTTPMTPVAAPAPAIPVSAVVSQINNGAAPGTVAAAGNFTGTINGHYYKNGQEVSLAQYMGPGWTPTQVATPPPVTSGPTEASHGRFACVSRTRRAKVKRTARYMQVRVRSVSIVPDGESPGKQLGDSPYS